MTPRCGVLIGTPRCFRACGLPNDPCVFHAERVCPRTENELRAVWGARLTRWRSEKQRQRFAA